MERRQGVAIGTDKVTENIKCLQQHILIEVLGGEGRGEGEGGGGGGRGEGGRRVGERKSE